jgi:hypothetical protein
MACYRIRVNYSIEADSPDKAFRIWITADKKRDQYLLFESLELVLTKHRGWLDEWRELDEEENS